MIVNDSTEELLTESRKLVALLAEYGELLIIARASWRLKHNEEPLAIAVPESFMPEVTDGARCFDLPLVRARVTMPTLLGGVRP